jgi:hypothetical protein
VNRALEATQYFSLDELIAMRDVIFNTAVASSARNASSPPKSPATLLKNFKRRPNSPENRGLTQVVRAQVHVVSMQCRCSA